MPDPAGTRRIALYHWDKHVGSLAVPSSYRPPIDADWLARIPAMLIVQSRSWLYDVRPTDVRLELRGEGAEQDVVAVCSVMLSPGDVALMIGFEPLEGVSDYVVDPELLDFADAILKAHSGG